MTNKLEIILFLNMENINCNIGTFRPTSNLSYHFTVDATNIEVTALFVTRIVIRSEFTNIVIYDVTDGTRKPTNFEKNGNTFTLSRTIEGNNTYIRKYEITMDYIHKESCSNHSSNLTFEDVITVGYSATQIK